MTVLRMTETCKLKHPQGSECGTCECGNPQDCPDPPDWWVQSQQQAAARRRRYKLMHAHPPLPGEDGTDPE
jgi:hypothetical protein